MGGCPVRCPNWRRSNWCNMKPFVATNATTIIKITLSESARTRRLTRCMASIFVSIAAANAIMRSDTIMSEASGADMKVRIERKGRHDKHRIAATISTRLRDIRAYSGAKQWAIADLSGTTQARLSGYEHGVTLPSLFTLIALAETYGVSIDYIVGRTDRPELNKNESKER